jgi:hypothetical protein
VQSRRIDSLKKLPIGLQDFPTLITAPCVYVDKTELIYQLVTEGFLYFLSRPRRFGKSLLVSTLASLFRGERELFAGLWISQSAFSWEIHPVIQIDFSRLTAKSPQQLVTSLNRALGRLARQQGIQLRPQPEPADTLELLIDTLRPRGKVVVLIDEYDYPIVQNLDDLALAEANHRLLQAFFSMLKSLQGELRFVFVTGVSHIVSLFSGMNNLLDITLHPRFACLTGLTEEELQCYFADSLPALPAGRAGRQGRSWRICVIGTTAIDFHPGATASVYLTPGLF